MSAKMASVLSIFFTLMHHTYILGDLLQVPLPHQTLPHNPADAPAIPVSYPLNF